MYIIIMTKDPLSFFLIFLYSEPLYSVDLKLTLQTLTYKTLIAKRASLSTSPQHTFYSVRSATTTSLPALHISHLVSGDSARIGHYFPNNGKLWDNDEPHKPNLASDPPTNDLLNQWRPQH
jgi:hypothetical protein